MIHVNMKYINAKDGSFREAEARNNTDFEGFAIISIYLGYVSIKGTWPKLLFKLYKDHLYEILHKR